jgi:hypothetical protein
MRGRWALIAASVFVFAAVAAQVLIPNLGEREVEDRLTAGGGSAQVTLGAFPAARLLFSDGERFEVEARELDLDLASQADVFERLDGFGVVDVSIADFTAGPFELDSFTLTRDGEGPYRLVSHGRASPQALAEYGFDRFEVPGEGLVETLLDPFLEEANVPVPLDLDMQLLSDGERVHVIEGDGSVAGFSMGPLAELLASAIVVRL